MGSRDGVDLLPSFDSREAIGAAARVAAVLNVVHYLGVCVQRGINESYWALASLDTLFVDHVDHGCKDRRGSCIVSSVSHDSPN